MARLNIVESRKTRTPLQQMIMMKFTKRKECMEVRYEEGTSSSSRRGRSAPERRQKVPLRAENDKKRHRAIFCFLHRFDVQFIFTGPMDTLGIIRNIPLDIVFPGPVAATDIVTNQPSMVENEQNPGWPIETASKGQGFRLCNSSTARPACDTQSCRSTNEA